DGAGRPHRGRVPAPPCADRGCGPAVSARPHLRFFDYPGCRRADRGRTQQDTDGVAYSWRSLGRTEARGPDACRRPGADVTMPAAAPRLSVEGLSKSFGGIRALKDVSFAIRAGEVHALLGENGAGKSTLVKIVSGLYQPEAGDFHLDGVPCRFASPL